MNRRAAAEAALVGNTVMWGATFVLVKAALAGVSSFLFLALRFSVATAVLLALWSRRPRTGWSRMKNPWPGLRAGALAGVFLFSGYVCQTLGLRLTSPPRSAFITGLSSVMVPLLAALVYRSKPQVSEVVGVLVATAGLGLMTLESASFGAILAVGRGDWLTFLCAIAYAAHIVALGHFSERLSFEVLSIAQIAAAAGLALSMFWWVEKPYVEWRPAVVYGILITGVLCTALAFTVQAWAMRYTTSTRTALIYMLEPVFAWITSYCMLGEGLSGRAAAGAGLILGGVMLVELKPLNPRRHPFT